jgi:hypothetical protein
MLPDCISSTTTFPGGLLRLKKQAWFLPVYFILWQWGAYRVAARRHRGKPFDAFTM